MLLFNMAFHVFSEGAGRVLPAEGNRLAEKRPSHAPRREVEASRPAALTVPQAKSEQQE